MAVSSAMTGWRFDKDNSRLDMYYRGTRAGHIDACGLQSALGLTVACGLTVTAGNLTVTAGDLILTGGDIRSGACGSLQLLCACGTGTFLASTCAAPCCAADGTVWAWDGSAGAVAPCGSGFLMVACACT